MNRHIAMGRLVADPETRYSQNGEMAICRFRLAVARRFKKQGEPDADFLNMVAFGKNAENIQKYFSKGSLILAESHVQTGSYKNKDGRTVYTTDFIVDSWEFAGGKQEEKKEESKVADLPENEFVPVPENMDEAGLPW